MELHKLDKETRLTLAICLSVVFMIAEVTGGIFAGSLAILTDAAHLLTDVAGFAIALLAAVMARKPATKNYTFGLARAEVLGALVSILTLWVMTAFLVVGAVYRLLDYSKGKEFAINGRLMFIIACLGILVNICLSFVFMEEHGGAFHSHDHAHGAEHEHGHSSHGAQDVESPHGAHSGLHSDPHSGHDHEHGHEHGHDHASVFVPPPRVLSAQHTDDHDHGHAHSSETTGLLTENCTTAHSNGHASHQNAYGSVSSAELMSHPHHTNEHYEVKAEVSDVNIQAAYLHVITDLIQSVGVAIAGLVIWIWPAMKVIDPLCTFAFSVLVMWSTISLLSRVMTILFEGVPAHVDYHAVHEALKALPGVTDVHDLHIWSISSNTISLTCHITVSFSHFSHLPVWCLRGFHCIEIGSRPAASADPSECSLCSTRHQPFYDSGTGVLRFNSKRLSHRELLLRQKSFDLHVKRCEINCRGQDCSGLTV